MRPLRIWMLAGLMAVPALAQPVISAKSGVVDYVEGQVFLANQALEYSPTHFQDVNENQVLRTEAGRAEVLLNPGVVLRLAENSSIRMITNRLIDTRVELLTGSASVEADQIAKDTNVTIACKDAQVALAKAGIYRFDAAPARVRVFKGSAQVSLNGQTTEVSGGKAALLGGTVAEVQKFESEDTDSLDNWSRRRGQYMAMANASAAKTLVGSGSLSSLGWGIGQPCMGVWGYNQWYGMMTYIPCTGMFTSPWGYSYWSPYTVMRAYYAPAYTGGYGYGGGGGMYNAGFPYRTAAPTAGGYSGAMASVGPMSGGGMSSGGSAMGGSTSAGAAGGGGSAGHGGGGGGGAAGGGGAGGHGR